MLVAFILNHTSYVLITTSTSSAHNGVHLILISKIVPIIIIIEFFYGQIVTCLLLISYVCYIISDRLNMFGIYIFVDTKLCTEEMHHVFVYTFKDNIT